MASTISCDIAIVGGGLAGGLLAFALRKRHPSLRIVLVEAGRTIGGNHIWSFFLGDIAKADRWIVEPLVVHAWRSYDVAFPGHTRTLATPYYSIESARLDAVVRAALPAGAVLTERKVLGASHKDVVLADGDRIEAAGVVDARGPADLSHLELGWQKFLGRELALTTPHDAPRPMVMDATVPQLGGYRFVYCLPFAETRMFVEDTYYSDGFELDRAQLGARIDTYAAGRGWQVAQVLREESGVLPVAMGGDFEEYWRSGGNKVAKVGMRAGLFHPTTGYSLPDAVRIASAIARAGDLSGTALHDLTISYARRAWAARGFYRMLDRMLFKAAEPEERYRILERFYRLDPRLIGRFYAGRTTMTDKLRLLAGKPPVPIGRAVAAVMR